MKSSKEENNFFTYLYTFSGFVVIILILYLISLMVEENKPITFKKKNKKEITDVSKADKVYDEKAMKLENELSEFKMLTDKEIDEINKLNSELNKNRTEEINLFGEKNYIKNKIVFSKILNKFEEIYNRPPYEFNDEILEKFNLSTKKPDFSYCEKLINSINYSGRYLESVNKHDDALKLYFYSLRACQEIEACFGNGVSIFGFKSSNILKRNVILIFILNNLVSVRRDKTEREWIWKAFEQMMKWDVELETVSKFQFKYQKVILESKILEKDFSLPPLLEDLMKDKNISSRVKEYIPETMDLLEKKYLELIECFQGSVDERYGNLKGFFSKINSEWEYYLMKKNEFQKEYFEWTIIKAFIPDFEILFKEYEKYCIERDMVLAILEIRAYADENNKLPEDIMSIGDDTEIPGDPFSESGNNFELKQFKDSFKIYSRGFNLLDDKGSTLEDIVISIPVSKFFN